MTRTYLTVQYAERLAAKALGARWDGQARRWYVPEGLALEKFQAWLPASASSREVAAAAAPQLLPATDKGIRLAHLMQGVSQAIAAAYPQGVWIRLEVVDVSLRGHVYLEVADRDPDGSVLAKARAMIWSRVAEKVLPQFQRETGMQLAPGIKLLVRARPTMHAQYGFGLEIDAIDPQYTLGDLEAKKREIRARLKAEGLWERNRSLPAPWDFSCVLVVAPDQAAGLGDFQAEAQRLDAAGVCRFVYAHSRFQGEGAAQGICDAAHEALQQLAEGGLEPDVIVVIRGGGAVNDLAWLNEYCLARFICEAPVPVYTGIGHQRDSTVLDEVAHTAFDTPSKVIAGIEAVIADRARKAQAAFEAVVARAQRLVVQAGAEVRHLLEGARRDAVLQVRHAAEQSGARYQAVREAAQRELAQAKAQVPLLMKEVEVSARATTGQARQLAQTNAAAVLERAGVALASRREAVRRAMGDVSLGAARAVQAARQASEAKFREIAGQGPDKTLRRGFAIVRDTQGKPVTSAAAAQGAADLGIEFQDGTVPVKVKENRQ